jgi:PAS domain S-box-containing protein
MELDDITCLYVDHDDASRDQIVPILRAAFKALYVASDGTEGLELYKMHLPDIVLSEIDMPGMDGLSMSEAIKALRPAQPIVIFSACNRCEYLMHLVNSGVDQYIVKPLEDTGLFLTLLDEVMRRSVEQKEMHNRKKILEEYKHIVDATNIVSKTNPKGIITYVNQKFAEISGYEPEELLGKSHNIIRDPENPDSMYKRMWDTIKAKKEWHGVVTNRRKDGSKYTVKASIFPILDENNEIIEYIAIRHDITEWIRLNRELAEHKSELERMRNYDVEQQTIAKEKLEAGIVNDLEADERYEIRALYRPSDILSGDFYSVYRKDDGSVLLYLIDGQGHGVSPALTVFAVSSIMHQLVPRTESLEELAGMLFPQIRNFLGEIEQLSFTLIMISADGNRLEYTAGGMYPFLLKTVEGVHKVKANNLPYMKFMPTPQVDVIPAISWDSLLVYSDGLIEVGDTEEKRFAPETMLLAPGLFDNARLDLEGESHDDDITVLFLSKRKRMHLT